MSKDKFPLAANISPSMPATFNGEIFKNVGKYARSAVLYAFEVNGGADGLATWARDNEDEFYTKLFPKIIARESEVTHHRTVDQLMDVIDGDYDIEDDDLPDVLTQNDVPPPVPEATFAVREHEGADDVEFEE